MATEKATEALRELDEIIPHIMKEMAWNSPSSGGPVIKQDFLKEADRRDKKTMTRIRKYLRDKLKTVEENGVEG